MAKPTRSRSVSGCSSGSSSDSGSRSRELSTSSSGSGSDTSESRSPALRNPSVAAKKARTAPPLKAPSPAKKASAATESVLYVGNLTRNVNDAHLKEIFSNFGEIVTVELVMDRTVQLSRGYAYVVFKTRADADKALNYMDGAQIDGNVVSARFTLLPRKQKSQTPRSAAATARKDAGGRPYVRDDGNKERLSHRHESSRRKSFSPTTQKRAPSIRRRVEGSPQTHVLESPSHQHLLGGSSRRRSLSPLRSRQRSPIRSSHRHPPGGSSKRKSLSPLQSKQRSPIRSPLPVGRCRSPRRSPAQQDTKSPPGQSLRTNSRSAARRGRSPLRRRGRSRSYSSQSPVRKVSPHVPKKAFKSRSPRRPTREIIGPRSRSGTSLSASKSSD